MEVFSGSRRVMTIEGYKSQPGEDLEIHSSYVSSGYFETLRIPIFSGRSFKDSDNVESQGVAIINEAFARRYWSGASPLGKHIQMGRGENNDSPKLQVVGIVKDCKYVTLGEEPRPFVYLNAAQSYRPESTLIVRTQGNPEDYFRIVQNEIKSLDSSLPVYNIKTMKQHLQASLFPSKMIGILLGGFGAVALILTISGIFGVVSYSVAQRTHELGIRIALGAGNADVLKMIIVQGMTPVFFGIIIGLIASLGISRLFISLLYGISASDPLTFAAISSLSIIIALIACLIPASRALKVDPMIVLKYD